MSSTKGEGRELVLQEWDAMKGLLERNQVVQSAPRPLPNTRLVPFLPSSALCAWKKVPPTSVAAYKHPQCPKTYAHALLQSSRDAYLRATMQSECRFELDPQQMS